jgi:DNA polymerase-1
LVNPIEKTELAKDGFWSTGADVLKELSGGPKKLIDLLLKQAGVSKLLTTYYHGFPAIREKMDWGDGVLHGQFNQCNVVTGRLSSSRPNQQNMPKDMDEFIESRFN